MSAPPHTPGLEFRVLGTGMAVALGLLASPPLRLTIWSQTGLYLIGGSVIFLILLNQCSPWDPEHEVGATGRILGALLSPLFAIGVLAAAPFGLWSALTHSFYRGEAVYVSWLLAMTEALLLLSVEAVFVHRLVAGGLEGNLLEFGLTLALLLPTLAALKSVIVMRRMPQLEVRATVGGFRILLALTMMGLPLLVTRLSQTGLLDPALAMEAAILLCELVVLVTRGGIERTVAWVRPLVGRRADGLGISSYSPLSVAAVVVVAPAVGLLIAWFQ